MRVRFPREERTKGEVLDDRKLGQHFSVEHLDHALVDFAPAIADARDVEQDGAVLPEGACLDIVDEADGREVHVSVAVVFHDGCLGDVAGLGCAPHGAFLGHRLVVVDGAGELCGAEDIRHKGVIVQAPDSVRAGWLQGVSQDELSHHPQVPMTI